MEYSIKPKSLGERRIIHYPQKRIIGLYVKAMAVIYATLIVKGKKTINDVPMVIREQVKQILIDLDLPELAE